jgi:anti-sigma regulatory factor (Ser/Thr protein kinase)
VDDTQPLVVEAVVVAADPRALDDVHATLARFWRAVDRRAANGTDLSAPSSLIRHQIGIAVAEVAANIAAHGHPAEAPGTMAVELKWFPERLEIGFADRGLPYVEPAPAPPVMADDVFQLAEHGRGMVLIRSAIDEVDYHRSDDGMNRWRLTKYLNPG